MMYLYRVTKGTAGMPIQLPKVRVMESPCTQLPEAGTRVRPDSAWPSRCSHNPWSRHRSCNRVR